MVVKTLLTCTYGSHEGPVSGTFSYVLQFLLPGYGACMVLPSPQAVVIMTEKL